MMDESAKRAAATERKRRWRQELLARETPEEAAIRRAKAAAQRKRSRQLQYARQSLDMKESQHIKNVLRNKQNRFYQENTENAEEAVTRCANAAAQKERSRALHRYNISNQNSFNDSQLSAHKYDAMDAVFQFCYSNNTFSTFETFKYSCHKGAVSIVEESPAVREFQTGESPSLKKWKNKISRNEQEKDDVEVLVYIDEADVPINLPVLSPIENDISSVPKMTDSTRLQETSNDYKFPPNHESQKTPTKDLKRPHRTSTLSKIIDAAVMKEIGLKEKFYKKKIKIAKRNAKAREKLAIAKERSALARERIADALEKIAASN